MTSTLIKKWNKSGFTLLEIVISMGLITIAILAILRLQAQSLTLQSEAQFTTIAHYLAQDRLSRIQSEKELIAGSFTGDFGEEYPSLRYREEIEEIADVKNLFKIMVTIFPDEGKAENQFLVTTYLYRNMP